MTDLAPPPGAPSAAPASAPAPPRHDPVRPLALLALAELLAMTLWFSATAVLPALEKAWALSATGSAWLTVAVQAGFVAGALASAVLNLPDVMPARRMMAVSAAAGAAVNLALAWGVSSIGPALVLRFLTGVCLAGVYPPAMKVAAGHVSGRGRGLAIGILVGALTLGSATPHLVVGLLDATRIPYRLVLTISSILAALSAILVGRFVTDGPFAPRPAPFDPRQVRQVLRDKAVLLANLGYFGHMWELYAMWTWLAVFLAAALGPAEPAAARLLAFACIGVAGSAGCVLAGFLADRIGRTTVTIAAMAVSGACCLASPWAYTAPLWALCAFGLVWGLSVVADSAQFSASVTELAAPAYMGTALALQTSLGFALTMVTIWTLPLLAAEAGWRFVFVALAPGPLLGCLAMAALRRRPEAVRLAAGRR
ncbi:MAG TPA: MFS transporter [Candidatus Limnocylindrales bacterium]|nr:MFS transporter [Candidatus Limnocylindrales bacterium]